MNFEMMSGVLMFGYSFRNMVGRTRRVHYESEVGQGSGMAGTESTQDLLLLLFFLLLLPLLLPL